MSTGEIISLVLVSTLSLVAFIISLLQFKEKIFLFNNNYIYDSKKERETMNKKLYYRQSTIVFLLIGIIFLILGLWIIFSFKWLYWAEIAVVISVIIYAIISSVYIEKNK